MTDAPFLLDVMLNETEECIVFVDSEKVVKIGEVDPDTFAVAGVVVEGIVEGEPKWQI